MKLKLTIILISLLFSHLSFGNSDAEICYVFISSDKGKKNYQIADKNKHCIAAAKAGVSSAQYSVGMASGFSGNSEKEILYYRKAAAQRNIAAYLGLGHALRESNIWESIYWYQRHVSTKTNGYGYTARTLADIFKKLGDNGQSEYWNDICKNSPYQGCH